MKLILLTVLLLIHCFGFTQESRELTTQDLEKIIRETNKQVEQFRIEWSYQASRHCVDYRLAIEFKLDTFKIERIQERKLEIDFSTTGMLNSTYEVIDEYDKLLNKYYKTLLGKLTEKDTNVLRKAQKNWIQFRDSEIELIETIGKEKYSGGGTIQSLIGASRIYELTKERLLDLYNYLRSIDTK